MATLLELIGLARSTYYYLDANPKIDRQADCRKDIVDICNGAKMRYGYRRVAALLRRRTGIRIADKTVLKVMREEGMQCGSRRKRKYRSYHGAAQSECAESARQTIQLEFTHDQARHRRD